MHGVRRPAPGFGHSRVRMWTVEVDIPHDPRFGQTLGVRPSDGHRLGKIVRELEYRTHIDQRSPGLFFPQDARAPPDTSAAKASSGLRSLTRVPTGTRSQPSLRERRASHPPALIDRVS